MKIDVLWTPHELEHVTVQDCTAVLIDVLRAATSIITAIHHGARSVVPAASTEEAMRLANSLGRGEVLLSGERGGIRIEGFDLGNSPAEYAADVVNGRTIVMSTTNGTRVLASMAAARRVYVAAFANLSMVAGRLRQTEDEVLVVCAGRAGRVSVDDALCAGMLVEACAGHTQREHGGAVSEAELGDGAIAAVALAREFAPVTVDFLRETAGGRGLEEIGQGNDIEYCSRIDSMPVIPVFMDRKITRLES
jgi:2-phosphosulfolactate phosphatase